MDCILSCFGKGNSSKNHIHPQNPHNETELVIVQKQDQKLFSDLAYGCFIGALCGDAIGVPVEFKRDVTLDRAKECIRLPGGGPFKLGRGQVTDDSELALCLAAGLVEGNGVLDMDKIGGMYHKWLLSRPFDIGITTRTAFKNAQSAQNTNNHADIIRESSSQSQNSQSNGGLMRITPLCIWTSKLSKEDLIKAVREDTRLTHPNRTAQNVSIAYVYTINHLLNYPGESEKAYQKCKDLVKNDLQDKDMESWLQELEAGVLPPAHEKIGWVKIAFLYALHFLREKMPYEDAMIKMLKQGGDTDTNCCIVGGMLGALHGFKGIPEDVKNQVLSFEANQDGGIQRPDYLVPKKCAEKLIEDIIRIRPEKLEMRGEERKI